MNPFGAFDSVAYKTPPHKHRGSDFVHNGDGIVRAVRSGTIAYRGSEIANRQLGNAVAIQHNGYWSLYAHFVDGTTRVVEGQHVSAGVALGAMGETGIAHGVHLHIEIGVGSWDPSRSWANLVDPYPLVGGAGTPPSGDDDLTEDQAQMLVEIHRELVSGGRFQSPGYGKADIQYLKERVAQLERNQLELAYSMDGLAVPTGVNQNSAPYWRGLGKMIRNWLNTNPNA